jgi:hypothetical protein
LFKSIPRAILFVRLNSVNVLHDSLPTGLLRRDVRLNEWLE